MQDLPYTKALSYVLSQSVGALLAGTLALLVVPSIGFPTPSASLGVAWYLELLATFFLAFVVLQTGALAPHAHL